MRRKPDLLDVTLDAVDRLTHDHENNCPPKLQNTIKWVWPLLPFLGVAWAAVTFKKAWDKQGQMYR